MYSDDDLLPISGLQHLAFCPRQCALIHLEKVWPENFLTASGRVMHERVHEGPSEGRRDIRLVRGLALRSYRLGLSGIADLVEFQRITGEADIDSFGMARGDEPSIFLDKPKSSYFSQGEVSQRGLDWPSRVEWVLGAYPTVVRLPKRRGLWRPYPVEYKRGNPKRDNCDAVQLCAQAMCLEEMLSCTIKEGALFYGRIRRREIVLFEGSLREETEHLARSFHELIDGGETPAPNIGLKCKACSLEDDCLPNMKSAVMTYLRKNWKEAEFPL